MPDYLGEVPPSRRKLRQGHCIRKEENGTTFTARCDCGWSASGLRALPDIVEEAAYMHRTEPNLIVPASSDVLRDMRIERYLESLRINGATRRN